MQEESVASRVYTLLGLDIDLESEVITTGLETYRRKCANQPLTGLSLTCITMIEHYSRFSSSQRSLFCELINQSSSDRSAV